MVGTVVGLLCVAFLIATEVNSPWALLVFLAGLIARRKLGQWFDTMLSHDSEAWLYNHARAWGQGLHDTWNPKNCAECGHKKTPE